MKSGVRWILMLLAAFVHFESVAQNGPAYPPPPADAGHVVSLCPNDEPGEKLVITGILLQGDRTTALADCLLYLYQTDAQGEYRLDKKTGIPRLHAWLRTNAQGAYEVHTIKPGSYPGTRIAAHIHAFVMHADGRRTAIKDFLFNDDKYLSADEKEQALAKGRFSHVLSPVRDASGVLRAARDIVVEVR